MHGAQTRKDKPASQRSGQHCPQGSRIFATVCSCPSLLTWTYVLWARYFPFPAVSELTLKYYQPNLSPVNTNFSHSSVSLSLETNVQLLCLCPSPGPLPGRHSRLPQCVCVCECVYASVCAHTPPAYLAHSQQLIWNLPCDSQQTPLGTTHRGPLQPCCQESPLTCRALTPRRVQALRDVSLLAGLTRPSGQPVLFGVCRKAERNTHHIKLTVFTIFRCSVL